MFPSAHDLGLGPRPPQISAPACLGLGPRRVGEFWREPNHREMSSKFTDLPFEVLLQIFQLYIDSIYDPEVLLHDLRRPHLPVRRFIDPKPKHSATAKRGIIRLVCKVFRSVIDSSSYWAGRTLVAGADWQ